MASGHEALFEPLINPTGRIALSIDGEAIPYGRLAAQAARHARWLAEQGVRPGDRVALWAQRHPATPAAFVGNALHGAVTVPINPAVGRTEARHVLEDAGPRVVLAAEPEAARGLTPEAVGLGHCSSPGVGAPPVRNVDDEPLLILYTSGTTGPPKGVVLSCRNVAANLDALGEAWALDEADTIVHALPLFHVHGLVLGLFGALRAGATMAWVPRFSPGAMVAALAGPRRVLFAVPTMYHRLAEAARTDREVQWALSAARLLVSGSAPLPRRDQASVEELAGRPLLQRYGLTETIILCAERHDDPRPGTVGGPLDGVELRLVDDDRHPLQPGDASAIGEVSVRGPSVFLGYHGQPEATRAVLDEEGWFFTGDLATVDDTGSVRIVGRRATDLIKTGGFKVGAGEVEAALADHAGVAEAAVLGEPDEDLGERVIAFVVPRDPRHPPEEQELIDHVAASLASHKRPRLVRYVRGLPRNAMGKVVKGRLLGS